ncbi:MAG: Gfo/Idh/MocA family oxidoreductase [Planctomycetales bacterium]|nr:Gfo/Idh/MocA family oxidoreductase [Planctomycetales bacterium]
MSLEISRRRFLRSSAASGLAVAACHASAAGAEAESAAETVNIAVMGVNGRGAALSQGFVGQPNCNIAAVCDVDERALAKTVAMLQGKQQHKPQALGDFRKALDDDAIDVLVVAAPNHWHGPATILGCKAGKHVYVEKPCCHNPREGELMIEAARKYKRVVTQGTQRRSWPTTVEAMGKLRDGVIGKLHYARSWYNNRRGSIGKGNVAATPEWLDWNLWQGPAPRTEFLDNVVHYNWHWHWRWGNGELGNNGVHALDLARWGMGVDFPTRVASGGGRWRWEDDQETPDTHIVTFDFPQLKTITWEGLSWSPFGPGGERFGVSFHGDEGTMLLLDTGYTIYDMQNKEVSVTKAAGNSDAVHQADFLACIKSGERPHADVEIAHKSALLCHLGNIAQRTDRTLRCDATDGRIQEDAAAMELWGREYENGWQPNV